MAHPVRFVDVVEEKRRRSTSTHNRFGSIIRDNSFRNRIPAVALAEPSQRFRVNGLFHFLFLNLLGRRYAVRPEKYRRCFSDSDRIFGNVFGQVTFTR